jgi:phage major head subunit gpT-like protein
MQISAQNLTILFTTFDPIFQQGYEMAPSDYEPLTTIAPSGSGQQMYPWLKMTTGFREWIGDRVHQALEATAYTIVNKTWENSIAIEREKIEDDEYEVYGPAIRNLGWDAKLFPNQLIFGMMKAASSNAPQTIGHITVPVPIGYDGQNLYSANHPVGLLGQTSATGPTTPVSNIDSGGSGVYWYLVDAHRPIRSFILQKRREFAVTHMNALTDEAVYNQRTFRYGVDGRYNAGVGLWQLTYASNQDLTNPVNYGKAVAALEGFKTDAGIPFGAWSGPPNTRFLVVPPSLRQVATQLLHGNFGAGTISTIPMSNIYLNDATLIVSPWLA